MNLDETIFREYDLRGIYGEEITAETAALIGRSFGSFIREKGYKKVLVGYDNRLSSPLLHDNIITGLTLSGADVIDLGLVTTPMYYFARYFLHEDCGIMITASHNPKEYNGFKIAFDSIGNAYGEKITEFKNYTKAGNFMTGAGQIAKVNIKNDYIELMKNAISLGNRKVRAVVDCGNGTGSIIIKDILDALQIEYIDIFCTSDGNFPNHHPDPSVKKNMEVLSKTVKENNYDIGIGIDGDADRVGIVLENGEIIGADLYMLIMYKYLNENLKNRQALIDVKCSRVLIDELKKLDIEVVMNRTGNSYINKRMQDGNFDFGGEFSGHLYFRDKFPGFDDGIYAGLRMIELLSHKTTPLSAELEGIAKYYVTEELKFAATDETKFEIIAQVKEYATAKGYQLITLDGVRVEFADAWALVRASNTGPNITARFEAKTEARLTEVKDEFITLLNSLIASK